MARYQGWSDYTAQDVEEFFSVQENLPFDSDGTWFQLAAVRRSDDVLVGDIAVHFYDAGRQVEVGFTIDSAYQNCGYGFEALTGVVERLFKNFSKHRVVANVDARNIAAQKLLEKAGFRREGHFVQNAFFKGAWCDEYLYALLSKDF